MDANYFVESQTSGEFKQEGCLADGGQSEGSERQGLLLPAPQLEARLCRDSPVQGPREPPGSGPPPALQPPKVKLAAPPSCRGKSRGLV